MPSLAASPDDWRELAQLRYALEVGAIELAIRTATDEQIERLSQITQQMEAALRGIARTGLALRRRHRQLLAQSFQAPVPFDGASGMTLDADPAAWSRQLAFLAQLQREPKLPLLPRLVAEHAAEELES